MTTLNCIVVDDDILSREIVKQCIKDIDFLNLIGEADSAAKAHILLQNNKVDLIFLDIVMPEMSGMDFIREYKGLPQIIFITVDKSYAAEAFDYNVTDFVTKPIDPNRFLKAATKALDMHDSFVAKNEEVYIKKESSLVKLDLREILYIEALADYVNIYTKTQRHTILSTMKSMENKLPEKYFCRVHRSFIVRLDQIVRVDDGGTSITIGDHTIPVSRNNKELLLNKIKTL